jgi:hypothetical protein
LHLPLKRDRVGVLGECLGNRLLPVVPDLNAILFDAFDDHGRRAPLGLIWSLIAPSVGALHQNCTKSEDNADQFGGEAWIWWAVAGSNRRPMD